MKRCSKCGVEKDESEFSKCTSRRDGLQAYCKDCKRILDANYHKQHASYNSERYKKIIAKRREVIYSYKTPCVKCGESRDYIIEFHHVDPANKKFAIGTGVLRSKTVVQEETKKCVCLCKNCHYEFHHFYGTNPEHPVEALNEYLNT